MRIELFNRSKYRDGSAPGDDVPLVVPGAVYGIFDGATDPRGALVEGVPAGRLAALVVAAEMASLAADPAVATMAGSRIVGRLAAALKERTDPLDLAIPPSTTLAVALDCGDNWRFLLLGDSGIRLNGHEVHRHDKIIDTVSATARVATFNDLRSRWDDVDDVEHTARMSIFLGFENAIGEGTLSAQQAQAIIDKTIETTGLHDWADTIAKFLMGGVQTQHLFGNAAGNPLCFDTMNGTTPKLGELADFVRAKSAVETIEIFSDGYANLPDAASVPAWEKAFDAAEAIDYHKIGAFATVKGSTRSEYFDDRTVLILA